MSNSLTNATDIPKSFIEHMRELYKVVIEVDTRMIDFGFYIKNPPKELSYSSKIKNQINRILKYSGIITPEKLGTAGYWFWDLREHFTKGSTETRK